MHMMTVKLRICNNNILLDIIGESFDEIIANAKKEIKNMRDCCFDNVNEQSCIYDGVHHCSIHALQSKYTIPLPNIFRNCNISYTPNYNRQVLFNSYLNSTTCSNPWRYFYETE